MNIDEILNPKRYRESYRAQKITSLREISGKPNDLFEKGTSEVVLKLKQGITQAKVKSMQSKRKMGEYLSKQQTPKEKANKLAGILPFVRHQRALEDIRLVKDHLYAITEMKVIYCFKNVEIGMKSLIREAYPGTNMKDFYKW